MRTRMDWVSLICLSFSTGVTGTLAIVWLYQQYRAWRIRQRTREAFDKLIQYSFDEDYLVDGEDGA